ncbi:hypothetical protein J9303_19570 [Bacillaceae bacterium Marseille-Q3522]|nr:hypothetical protein [Bacillaceae bacterium Marseille-Q3522]
MNVVQKAFDTISAERVHQIAYRKTAADPGYIAARERAEAVFDELKDSLGEETQKKLLFELETAFNDKDSFLIEYAYRQGLEDSTMIHKELSKLGISIAKEDRKHHYLAFVPSTAFFQPQSNWCSIDRKDNYLAG